MHEKKINLVVSDIDGTLLTANHTITKELVKTVEELNNQKIPFVLASARSPSGMADLAQKLQLTTPLVCYNGALIVQQNSSGKTKTLYSHPVNHNELTIILDVVHNMFPRISINFYSENDWIVSRIDKWVKIESEITKTKPIVKNILVTHSLEKLDAHKILFIGESSQISELLNYLRKLKLTRSSFYLSKENYLEVTHKNVSKQTAVKELTHLFHIPKEHVMTIGDNYNDIPMLKYAGLGVAMKNAPLDVQKSADALTDSNDQNGVSKALVKYVLPS